MKSIANKRGKLNCLISAVIIVAAYSAQRFLSLVVESSKPLLLIEAMVFTIAVAVVYALVKTSNETFYGLLVAVFGFRMLPPSIPQLGDFSAGGEIVYYIVTKASVVIFALLIIKLYRAQKTVEIKPLPIIVLMVAVPFCTEVGNQLSEYVFDLSSGNMLYSYFIAFLFYAIACFVTLLYANFSDSKNGKFIADYTLVALAVNMARRVCVIIANLINNNHTSRSYYCWIAIYVFFFIAFYIIRAKKINSSAK